MAIDDSPPPGWNAVRIEDIAEVRFSGVDKHSREGECEVLLCNYMDVWKNPYIRRSLQFMPSTASSRDIERFSLRVGDVLITKDSETKNEIAEPSVVDESIENLVLGYHLALLRPNSNCVLGHFLAAQLRLPLFRSQFINKAAGATRYGLGLDAVKRAIVWIPGLQTQSAICKVLRAVDDTIEATRTTIEQNRKLKRTLSQHLLANGVSQNSFVEKRLGDVLREPIRNGYSATSPNYETGLWITTLSAVSSEGFNPLGVKPAPTGVEKVLQTLLQSGDIIVSRSNTRDLVGLAGLYVGIPFPCSYSDLLMRVRFDPDIISPEFALLCLLSDESRLYFRNTGRGTSGSMKKIDRSILENLPMRIPHLSVQAKVVEHIKSISERISIELKYLSQLIQLSSTLSHALLTGEIAQMDHCAKVEVST